MDLEIAVLSKAGGRPRNEDACGYWTSESACCWVLSDGAGGHGGGDVASRLVVSTVLREFAAAPAVSRAAVLDLLRGAQRAVLDGQAQAPALADMCATGAVLLVDRAARLAIWGHVGDSRVYALRGGRVLLHTRDHSVLQSIVEAGYADPSWLRTHPQRNVLLSALGSEEDFEPAAPEQPMALLAGDVFLLCSDGLWEYVEEPAMERALAAADGPSQWLAMLEAQVLDAARPGHDNYSAIAVGVRE